MSDEDKQVQHEDVENNEGEEENEEECEENEEEEQEGDNNEEEQTENNEDEGDDEQKNDEQKDDSNATYIRLRGLPWNVTTKEIVDFLTGANVANGEKGVYIVKNKSDGKNTGEAFVQLESENDEEAAFKHDRENMGHRYIEIFKATAEEAEFATKRTKKTGRTVKLRGLPYSVDEDMIEDFFDGLNIRKDREGVVIVMDRRGRATGEAYVQFKTELDAQKALDRNREKIGHRYIEIFRSSLSDLKRALGSRHAPYDRPGRGGGAGRNVGNGRGSGMNRNRRGGFGGNFGDGGFNGFNNGGGRMNSGGGFGNNNGGFGMNRNNMRGGGGGFGNNNFSGNGGGFDDNNFGGGNNYGGNGAFCIHMRGLPYYSYENDISDFFAPLRPSNIEIIYNKRGLHSGTANVFFTVADDAIQAMRKHKEQMGARYIELFYDGNTQKGGRI